MAEFFCEHCQTQLNSKMQWDSHITGAKHMSKIASSQQESLDDDMSAIYLPNGIINCKYCDGFFCSGTIPMKQHLAGKLHKKNIQQNRGLVSSKSPVSPIGYLHESQKPPNAVCLTSQTTSMALVQTDGSYKCQLCPDFQCTGPIPMQAHLSGKQHKKKLLNNLPVKNVSTLEVGNVFSSSTKLSLNPSFSSGPKMSVEERVEQAWKHVAICGYEYDDSFATLSVDNKITALSSHFAFISKNDPIPSLVQYLSI